MMALTPAQKRLASALRDLKTLQDAGHVVLRSAQLTRLAKESLLKNGFLRRVIRGWYIPTRPGETDGDSTPWYAAMPEFLREYCRSRFGDEWYVSPEYSLLLHAGSTIMPKQVVIHSPHAKNGILQLPNGSSLLDYQAKDFAPTQDIGTVNGINVLTLPAALIRVPEIFYRTFPDDAYVALHQLPDASDLARHLLAGGHSTVAGRLTGALRHVGRDDMANEIKAPMQMAGYTIIESNPFEGPRLVLRNEQARSAAAMRIRIMWERMRETVLAVLPNEPGPPSDIEQYMDDIEAIYVTDAYHSLSIEGYRVTDELIERVATGTWDPETHIHDADARAAMAAHGYWRAHNVVRESIRRILAGDNAGTVYRNDHGTWFRELFAPSVDAGILNASDLAGYRSHPVYIRNAVHVPPSSRAVREMMPELVACLQREVSASVRAVLGHFVFVYIHPYMDGNGRLGRFLMNAMFASGGYPWTIIPVERRAAYLEALDAASAHGNVEPFARFVASCVRKGN